MRRFPTQVIIFFILLCTWARAEEETRTLELPLPPDLEIDYGEPRSPMIGRGLRFSSRCN